MVMRFKDLDVPAFDKLRGHLFDELAKKRHPDRGVGAIDGGNTGGGLAKRLFIRGGQAGGADNKGRSAGRGDAGMGNAGSRAGEVDDDVSHRKAIPAYRR